MTTHWKKYRKVIVKFHDDVKYEYDSCEQLFEVFLRDNEKIFTDFHFKWDFAEKQNGYHVNMYLKCSNWTRITTQYQPPSQQDMRFFVKIIELLTIRDSCDWISYMYMRDRVNFLPRREQETLIF